MNLRDRFSLHSYIVSTGWSLETVGFEREIKTQIGLNIPKDSFIIATSKIENYVVPMTTAAITELFLSKPYVWEDFPETIKQSKTKI